MNIIEDEVLHNMWDKILAHIGNKWLQILAKNFSCSIYQKYDFELLWYLFGRWEFLVFLALFLKGIIIYLI